MGTHCALAEAHTRIRHLEGRLEAMRHDELITQLFFRMNEMVRAGGGMAGSWQHDVRWCVGCRGGGAAGVVGLQRRWGLLQGRLHGINFHLHAVSSDTIRYVARGTSRGAAGARPSRPRLSLLRSCLATCTRALP